MFSEDALTVLKTRYLQPGETPEGMFRRVAAHVAAARREYGEDREKACSLYTELLSSRDFLPNTPTLINAGKPNGQLAACFVLPIEDSLTGIFEILREAALIHQSGGGTGFSFSRLRPRGARVSTTGGVSSGPVSFISVYNAATEVVKQGAVRSGANMAILRIDHPDIREFIAAKQTPEALKNFNLSVGVTDAFMAALQAKQSFSLINPHDGAPVVSVAAEKLFDEIVEMAWHNGEPGLFFLDTVNRGNPTPALGAIESPNPCSEQPLLPYESCVLGSINLTRFVRAAATGTAGLDWDRLAAVVRRAVVFLDDVITVNQYPLSQIETAALRTRKIGLGVMGLADLLIQLGIPYASRTAALLTAHLMKHITKTARETSASLARTRGPFPAFGQSVFARRGLPPLRNATVTTIAPTGTISIIAGCSSGIEPLFGLKVTRRVLDGQALPGGSNAALDLLMRGGWLTGPILDAIERTGSVADTELPLPIKRLLATAHDIPPRWHLAHLAAAQRYTDNGVSKTVNLPRNARKEDVAAIFLRAYAAGCKGVTVYRDGSRSEQVLTVGTKPVTCQSCEF